MRTSPLHDHDEEEPRGVWGKLKDRIGLGEYDDEADDEIEVGSKRRPVLRLSQARVNCVSIWQTIQSLDNAQQAADGLKEGRSQIVNLEKASPEICARVIDFLNGVTYALDGYVEKVGEKVYLFTPHNVVVDVASGSERSARSPFVAEN